MEISSLNPNNWLWMTRVDVKTCFISWNTRILIKVVKWEMNFVPIFFENITQNHVMTEWFSVNHEKCFKEKTCAFNCHYIEYLLSSLPCNFYPRIQLQWSKKTIMLCVVLQNISAMKFPHDKFCIFSANSTSAWCSSLVTIFFNVSRALEMLQEIESDNWKITFSYSIIINTGSEFI